MYDRLVLRPAHADEADVIATMWSEAAAWLRSRSTDQWQYPANVGGIAGDIARGNVHVLLDGAAYLGTITIDGFADPEFWVPADAPDEALYAHRLITRPSSRGASLGSTMLDWASREAERIGKRWLRVDVWKTNADLGRYYEAQGFERVRTVDLPHRRSGALYQRRAGAEESSRRVPAKHTMPLPGHRPYGATDSTASCVRRQRHTAPHQP
ncbi:MULTISPECIES: GNAT family N-acetyltransferase [unclassified Streptomyces]|uniref:GNAT family N-acetyltransferase n=1 Tax=unclassified Streptomyces TaxID=2593676 RepID=UPI00035D9437|nr:MULTISPECIES: GNAT family N-acetyltransferase [unclassified Streptomyces]